MPLAPQLLANGLVAGALYALVASGFSIIYSTNKFIHFAHGATIAAAAYVFHFALATLGLGLGFAAIVAIAFAALVGYLMNRLVYRGLLRRKSSPAVLLIASVALLVVIESSIVLIFGSDITVIDAIGISKGIDVLGAVVTPLQMAILALASLLLAGLFLFTKMTKLGLAMRAVADNRETAEVVGISSEKIFSWSFIIGSALAGIAAILIGMEQSLEPTMGTHLMIKGLTAAIVGGIGSPYGAVLGAVMLGLAENLGVWYFPSGYKDAIAFAVLFAFLLFRPQGLLGGKKTP